MHLYHMTTSANRIMSCYHEIKQPGARGQYKKKICFVSKQACIIAYEVRISCKGPLSITLYVLCYLEKPILSISNRTCGCLLSDVRIEYIIAPVSLTESVFMKTFHHLKNDSKSCQKHYWQCGIELSSQSSDRNS